MPPARRPGYTHRSSCTNGNLYHRPQGRTGNEALSANRPVVFEAYTDANVPTLPPHITFEQAKEYTSALLKGDPEEEGIIKQTIKDVVEGILPHKG